MAGGLSCRRVYVPGLEGESANERVCRLASESAAFDGHAGW